MSISKEKAMMPPIHTHRAFANITGVSTLQLRPVTKESTRVTAVPSREMPQTVADMLKRGTGHHDRYDGNGSLVARYSAVKVPTQPMLEINARIKKYRGRDLEQELADL